MNTLLRNRLISATSMLLALFFFCTGFFCTGDQILAATLVETGSFSDISESNFYSSPSSSDPNFFGVTEPVVGINKFDPSLGTLNSVTLDVEFDLTLDTRIFVFEQLAFEDPHSAEFSVDTLIARIGYSSNNGLSTFPTVGTVLATSAMCSADGMEDPCESLNTEGETVIGSEILSDLSSYVPSDFVGVGSVVALRAGILFPNASTFAVTNVDEDGGAEAEILATVNFTSLTVTYEFTPVPEPSSILLGAMGLVAMLRLRLRSLS